MGIQASHVTREALEGNKIWKKQCSYWTNPSANHLKEKSIFQWPYPWAEIKGLAFIICPYGRWHRLGRFRIIITGQREFLHLRQTIKHKLESPALAPLSTRKVIRKRASRKTQVHKKKKKKHLQWHVLRDIIQQFSLQFNKIARLISKPNEVPTNYIWKFKKEMWLPDISICQDGLYIYQVPVQLRFL